VARNGKRDDIDMQDIPKLKTDAPEPKEAMIIFSPSSLLPRTHFDNPEVRRRAHSIDGVLLA
jgi:hypothetical protein